jgi:hypothetical protein
MATSKIDICNLALSMIGERTIVSFSDSNSRARLCDSLYEQARSHVLSAFDWPFARAFTKLQELSGVSIPEGMYAYKVPTTCVVPRTLHPKGTSVWWELIGDMILVKTHQDQYLYYTKLEVNPNAFSHLFITSVAELLAAWLAFPITGDKKMAESKMQTYLINLNSTISIEANIGNDYRRSDEDPNKDSFVNPDYATTVLGEYR